MGPKEREGRKPRPVVLDPAGTSARVGRNTQAAWAAPGAPKSRAPHRVPSATPAPGACLHSGRRRTRPALSVLRSSSAQSKRGVRSFLGSSTFAAKTGLSSSSPGSAPARGSMPSLRVTAVMSGAVTGLTTLSSAAAAACSSRARRGASLAAASLHRRAAVALRCGETTTRPFRRTARRPC